MKKMKALAAAVLGGAMLAAAGLPPAGPVRAYDKPAPLPAPLPQVDPGRIIVTWNGGCSEVQINCVPCAAPAGAPLGTLAWAKAVAGVGTGAIVLKPVDGGTGWEVSGAIAVADGPSWRVPAQPWQPGLSNYTAVLVGDEETTALGRIDVGPGD